MCDSGDIRPLLDSVLYCSDAYIQVATTKGLELSYLYTSLLVLCARRLTGMKQDENNVKPKAALDFSLSALGTRQH